MYPSKDEIAPALALASRLSGEFLNTIDQRNDSLAPTPSMITCSSAIDRIGPNMPSIGDLFPGTFHAYPGSSGSGFDLAEQEVAQVLQSMRRNTGTGSDLQN